jgi:hypothetical protein
MRQQAREITLETAHFIKLMGYVIPRVLKPKFSVNRIIDVATKKTANTTYEVEKTVVQVRGRRIFFLPQARQ